jgi:hypothetical protein
MKGIVMGILVMFPMLILLITVFSIVFGVLKDKVLWIFS